MVHCFFTLLTAQNTIVRRKNHILTPQNITGDESILSQQPEDLVFVLAGEPPKPFVNRMSIAKTFKVSVSFR